MRSVYEKYSPDKKGEEEIPPGSYSVEQILGEKNYPESEKNARHGGRAVLHSEQKKNPEKQREYDAKKWERKGQQIRQEREAASNEA